MNRQHLTSSLGGWKRFRTSVTAFSLAVGAFATPALAAGGFVSATASSYDAPTPPSMAVDGNKATRWSASGAGQWIRGDMGSVKPLNGLDIAWFRGNERINLFDVATSTDGTTFTRVFVGISSGKTADFDRVTFPTVNARYVRVTFYGSTQTTWGSITDMAALSGATIPDPEPENPDPENPDPENPDPGPGATQDKFGVTMIYPTKSGGEQWFLADNATSDKRFDPQNTITRNSDGSWKMKNSKVRMSVFTSTGYSASKIPTYDRDVLASRGYMQAANDWRNVEMTGFIKVNSTSDVSDNFAWYARGGKHNDNHSGCEGSAYKGSLHYDGRVRWQKETWHVSYEQAAYKSGTSALRGRWVGFKSVMRNTKVNGKDAVRLEMYLNENADKKTWKKVYDMVDSGSWGGDASHCGGGVNAMPISWGGPIAVFRWDSATDVDFKWMSVREIPAEQ
ncbi:MULTISPECIES: discoidin domain-containing protein [Myxococcus]|uniref:discoidin domain-containing protein n=1 Tax=Myxococcus TaxID=32 RepID=UPI0011418A9E|nr:MULTISPECIES: discoidin domain-containing protein [Myxococcus]NOK00271.1 discoidin domain-containing protein [Myxococcus xanthus]